MCRAGLDFGDAGPSNNSHRELGKRYTTTALASRAATSSSELPSLPLSLGKHSSPGAGGVLLLDPLPQLALLAPSALASLQGTVPPSHHVVVLAHPLLREDAAAQRHGRQLDENLELYRQTSVDGVQADESEVAEEGDAAKAEGAAGEALGGDGRDCVGGCDVGDIGGGRHGGGWWAREREREREERGVG